MGIKIFEDKMAEKNSRIVLKMDRICYSTLPVSDIGAEDRERIAELCDIVAAICINPLYYWIQGTEGMNQLYKTHEYAREKKLYIIYELGVAPDAAGVQKLFAGAGDERLPDAIILSVCMSREALQSVAFELNKGSGALLLCVKNATADAGLIGEMARQTAPLSGYSNIGIFTDNSADIVGMRRELPICFFLYDELENVKMIKSCFGRDGRGAAVCVPSDKPVAEVNKLRIRIEKMRKNIMDDSFVAVE